MNITGILSILMVSIMLFSCAGKGGKKDEDAILPAEEIYNNSMDNLEKKKYKKAIEGFEELERTYPYSKWAVKSKIMSAYTSYKNEEYNDAVITLEKFIGLHPGNKDIEYAYYLRALCYYEQISDVRRDQSYSIYARDTLKEVIARFPLSEYARDAQVKLDLILDHLAGKEVTVGRFYLKNGKYIAAINRFKEVVDNYQTTSHVPEALHRLVEANVSLGLQDEARKYASVLGYNYPGSKWYAYSYELIEGKKPDFKPEGAVKEWFSFFKDPLKKLKGQPNLAENVNKDVRDIGGNLEVPVESQPVSGDIDVEAGAVKVVAVQKAPATHKSDGMLNKIGKWFKNIKLPFTDK